MDRKAYHDETHRTIPLMKGRTIEDILTAGSFDSPSEVTGLTIRFTDGTEVRVDITLTMAPNGNTVAGLDVARSRGLYSPRNPRQATNAAGEVVELS